jgi:hypothetical protein
LLKTRDFSSYAYWAGELLSLLVVEKRVILRVMSIGRVSYRACELLKTRDFVSYVYWACELLSVWVVGKRVIL